MNPLPAPPHTFHETEENNNMNYKTILFDCNENTQNTTCNKYFIIPQRALYYHGETVHTPEMI